MQLCAIFLDLRMSSELCLRGLGINGIIQQGTGLCPGSLEVLTDAFVGLALAFHAGNLTV